jgi:hypothetical protein
MADVEVGVVDPDWSPAPDRRPDQALPKSRYRADAVSDRGGAGEPIVHGGLRGDAGEQRRTRPIPVFKTGAIGH